MQYKSSQDLAIEMIRDYSYKLAQALPRHYVDSMSSFIYDIKGVVNEVAGWIDEISIEDNIDINSITCLSDLTDLVCEKMLQVYYLN